MASPADDPPVIVLSPHLDDAVISVGALMARWGAQGRRVTVVTVFTGYPERPDQVPGRYRRLLIYDRRRAEDEAALKCLGAEPIWWGFCERAVLLPPLPRLLGVFSLPSPAVVSQFHNLPRLRRRIGRLASAPSSPLILAPLGIGGHVDHVETLLACVLVMMESGSFGRFLFYDDAYVMAGRARRRHLLAARERWPRRRSPALAGLRAAAMLTAIGRAGRGPRVEEYLPALSSGLDWQPSLHPIGEFEDMKLGAMKLYTSQMKALGGYPTFSAMVKRWHGAQGGNERLWAASLQPRTSA